MEFMGIGCRAFREQERSLQPKPLLGHGEYKVSFSFRDKSSINKKK
jgi:hypothetical protein